MYSLPSNRTYMKPPRVPLDLRTPMLDPMTTAPPKALAGSSIGGVATRNLWVCDVLTRRPLDRQREHLGLPSGARAS